MESLILCLRTRSQHGDSSLPRLIVSILLISKAFADIDRIRCRSRKSQSYGSRRQEDRWCRGLSPRSLACCYSPRQELGCCRKYDVVSEDCQEFPGEWVSGSYSAILVYVYMHVELYIAVCHTCTQSYLCLVLSTVGR
jgi:hypothetical protein